MRPIHKTAMAMIGILTETYVGNYRKIRHFVFDRPDGLLNNAIFSIRLGTQGVFLVGNTRNHDGRDTKFSGLFYNGDQIVDG